MFTDNLRVCVSIDGYYTISNNTIDLVLENITYNECVSLLQTYEPILTDEGKQCILSVIDKLKSWDIYIDDGVCERIGNGLDKCTFRISNETEIYNAKPLYEKVVSDVDARMRHIQNNTSSSPRMDIASYMLGLDILENVKLGKSTYTFDGLYDLVESVEDEYGITSAKRVTNNVSIGSEVIGTGKDNYIYKYYHHDKLLYVGQTQNWKTRYTQHSKDSAWFGASTRYEVAKVENKAVRDITEIYLICKDRPIFNITHNKGYDINFELPPTIFTHLSEYDKDVDVLSVEELKVLYKAKKKDTKEDIELKVAREIGDAIGETLSI